MKKMKTPRALLLTATLQVGMMFGGTIVVGLTAAGCTKQQAKDVTDVAVEVALAECVALNMSLDEPALQAACRFADDAWPVVRRIVFAQKKGAAKLGCGK